MPCGARAEACERRTRATGRLPRRAARAHTGRARRTVGRATPSPGSSIGLDHSGLVKHLTLADERYWFRCVVGGDSADYFPKGRRADWLVAPDESADEIIGAYRAEIARRQRTDRDRTARRRTTMARPALGTVGSGLRRPPDNRAAHDRGDSYPCRSPRCSPRADRRTSVDHFVTRSAAGVTRLRRRRRGRSPSPRRRAPEDSARRPTTREQ